MQTTDEGFIFTHDDLLCDNTIKEITLDVYTPRPVDVCTVKVSEPFTGGAISNIALYKDDQFVLKLSKMGGAIITTIDGIAPLRFVANGANLSCLNTGKLEIKIIE